MELNPYSRNQPGLALAHLYPDKSDGTCACGCGTLLTGRKTRWATKECTERALRFYWTVKGDSVAIRQELYKRDKGVCAACGCQSRRNWDADHIVPVHRGGGGCDMDNFQTLCVDCHKAKTLRDMGVRKRHSRIISTAMSERVPQGPVMAVGEDDLWIYDIDVHPKPVAEFTVIATIVSVEQSKPRVFIEDLYLED